MARPILKYILEKKIAMFLEGDFNVRETVSERNVIESLNNREDEREDKEQNFLAWEGGKMGA